jgi:hypothetical protein
MEHGKVTSVEYRDGVVYCGVRPMRTTSEYTALPVLKPHSGFIQVPQLGQQVTMEKLDDGTRFISNVLAKEGKYPEGMSKGDLAIQLDGGTKLNFKKQSNGDYNIELEASGNITIDGIDFDEHTHPYSWTDSGGSGKTDPPE